MIESDILALYDQPWRYHHTRKHLEYMKEHTMNFFPYCSKQGILFYAILFHDAVYEPLAKDNEDKSIELLMKYIDDLPLTNDDKDDVISLIRLTKHPHERNMDNELEKAFIDADWHRMGCVHDIDRKYAEWLDQYESDIFREFQTVPVEKYVFGRLAFLENAYMKGLITYEVFSHLKPLVKRKRRIGIYAGSFFPFHIGHLNILRKAEKVFDKVIVARGTNPQKQYNGDFSNVKKILPHHQVDLYEGQLVDYINSQRNEFCEPVLIRGLRNGYDLAQEINLARFIEEQSESRGTAKIPIAYITCDKGFEHISSSAIRVLPDKDVIRYIPNQQ